MAIITEEDKKLLESLNLSDIPEEDKRVVLDEIDDRMTKRFIANLLVSLNPQQAQQLEADIEKIPSENTQQIIEKIIETHPDAAKVLQDSAKQIMEELKAGQENKNNEDGLQNTGKEMIPPQAPSSETPVEVKFEDLGDTAKPAVDAPTTSPVPVSSESAAKNKPLPVPQQESSSPFGDEIKIVNSSEPTPAAETPAPEAPAPTIEVPVAPEPATEEAPVAPAPEPVSEENSAPTVIPEPSQPEPAVSEPQTASATTEPIPEPEKPTPSVDNGYNPFTSDKPQTSGLENDLYSNQAPAIEPESVPTPTSSPAAISPSPLSESTPPEVPEAKKDDNPFDSIAQAPAPEETPVAAPANAATSTSADPSVNTSSQPIATPDQTATSNSQAPLDPSQPAANNQPQSANDYYQS